MKRIPHLLCALTLILISSCTRAQQIKYYTYKVEQTLPHDISSYTQGLFFHDGELYESAGQFGESSMRKVDLSTGKVLKRANFDSRTFVEGSCVACGKLYILTWTNRVCYVYDLQTFTQVGQFPLRREGWGLTTDGKHLIMSDGSAQIYFTDPESFIDKKSITVRLNGKTVPYLNELEYIDGKIWANVYTTDTILIIDPASGNVEGVVDLTGILPKSLHTARTDVLNGIAYNEKDKAIYVTGKYWPKMYKISLVERGKKK